MYLHDPSWVANVHAGLGEWHVEGGQRFRWSTGHATFYVPAAAVWMVLPLRAIFPGPNGQPLIVRLTADDRFLGQVALADPDRWQPVFLRLPSRRSLRRFIRIDLRVDRTIGPANLGVQGGDARP